MRLVWPEKTSVTIIRGCQSATTRQVIDTQMTATSLWCHAKCTHAVPTGTYKAECLRRSGSFGGELCRCAGLSHWLTGLFSLAPASAGPAWGRNPIRILKRLSFQHCDDTAQISPREARRWRRVFWSFADSPCRILHSQTCDLQVSLYLFYFFTPFLMLTFLHWRVKLKARCQSEDRAKLKPQPGGKYDLSVNVFI